ncbi:unnamed protein product [Hydatigera taeniaeformis]|uniref:Uncharacterized protein n=1 Tax=Hydatigena taeniaeformis TaxID=6205 RepID=A0A158RF61_HYDTA|nr:unnamed protein product [Hydatigera taeniaeformis]
MSTNEQINDGTASELSSGNTNPAHPSESSVFPDLVCLLLRRLLPSARQRVCIFTDVYEPCAAHLKTLLSLLLQSSNINDGSGFVEDLVRQVSLIKPEQGVVTTRDEVMRALEPFLYRFIDDEEDEEDEDESATRSSNRIEDLVRIDVVSDHLTDQQRALHDHILTDKTCERAVRSGHLTDLLNCLSAGARLCCHPWLLSCFDEPAQWLLQDREPAFSPPLVTVPGLHFDGPASLLELRRTDDEISPHLLHLPSALQAPAHVRSRLMQLLPDAEQLKHLLITPCPSKRAGETSGTPLLAIKRLRRGQVAPVGSIEEQEEPFITRDTLRTVLLETANASYAKNETIAEPMDIHLSSSVEMESPLPTNADLVEQGSSAVPNHILSAEGKVGIAFFLLSLFAYTNSPFSLLCTRDKAVGLPLQLATTSTCPLKSVDVETVINQFYPLLSSTRWLCPQTIPHLLPQFLTSSGKIQRLRSLLLDLVRSPSPSSRPSETHLSQNHTNRTPSRRPRVIFLLCHRTALLDLLTAWLSIDPYLASLALLRAPIDQLDADGEDDSMLLLDDSHAKSGRSLWVDQVNAWPSGIQGPLLVLLHARSPSLSAAGLRMGPDTRLVICDADWRKDVVSTVKSKLRCWSINGLVDVPPRTRCNESLPPLLQAYRLVTEWDSGDSVEARLVKSTAIQLLPDSVFMTASPPAASAAFASTGRSRSAVALPLIPPSSRVQPNVVRQLVSCLRRRALWRSKTALPPLQSQVSSNTSMPPPLDSDGVEEEEEATTTQDDESDNASLFHKRAPIQKDLLIQCFDLHEPPRDVQAWCSSLAEPAAIAVEMHSDCLDPQLESVVSLPISEDSLLRAAGLNSYDDVLFQQSPIRLVPPEVLEMWELDQASWRETLEAVVEFTMGQGEPLFYLPPGESAGNMVEQEIADENNLPIEDAFKLPLWVPSFFEDPEFCKGPLPAPFDRLDLTRAIASNVAKTRDNSSSATTWGYASDAMAEAELPPFSSTVSPLFDSTNTTATRYPGSVGSSPAVNASASTKSAVETASPAMSYALKRTAVATLSARNSVNVSGGRAAAPPSKKRRLTGAAAMAARRAASNKAAAAAAATANSSAVTDGSAGRLIRLERDEKPLVSSSTQDRADLPSNSASGTGTTTGSATVAAASTPTITPATVSTTLTMTLPSNQKISIPRPFYSRDLRTISGGAASTTNQGGGVGSSGASASGTSFSPSARIRRVTSSTQITSSARLSGSGGGSSPAVPNGVTGVFPALNNPHLLAKYAITSTGKPTASQRQGPHPSGMVSFKYGSSSTVGHPQSSVSDIKPLEWSPLEEAALLMCTTKLQDIPLTVGNSCLSHSPHHQATATSTYTRMPNFRLVEFFLNNFHATRAYRSCRQCLLVYYRILSALVTSSAADLILPPTDEDGPISTYPHHLQHQQHQQHGSSTSVGRKVKNKLKSGLSTPIMPPSASPLDQNTSISGVSNDFTVASGGATASPANKLRGYQYFLYLESHLSTLATASTQTPGGSATVNTAAPITGLVDNQIINILRKCVREATPKSGNSSSHHHLHHHHHPGVSAMVSSHHPQTQAQQRVGGPATAATMLMRNAAAAAAAAAAASASQVPPQLPSGATVIQKNPSHIAALQEHNISPDTLITPAMVIKSKEEREARQRTEAVAAAAAAAAAVASSSASPTPSSVPSVAVVATSTPSVPVSGSAAVVVGSANTPGVLPTARVHHHSHQQHPTIVTISGTGSPSGGSNLQRSASILPFSTAASVNYHGGSGASPTVFRYTTPGSMGAAARQVSSTTATPTGILRRVGSSVVGGSPQSVFAVTPATASGTAHVISNTGGTTMVRRGVTLTPAGVSQAGGVANASGCGAGGVTVLATTSSARPASVIYHHHQHQTSGATPAGITLLSAGAQALPQIIRPRQQFRPGTALPTQRFVRTLSVTPAGSGIAASGAGQATTTTPIHRTRDGLFTSPIQQHTQQRGGGGGVVVPESQILLSRIHPVSSGSRRPATANIAASGGARQQQSGQPTPPPPPQSSSASSHQPQ